MELKDYLEKASKEKWALGQFNFSTLGQLKGIFLAAKKLKSPIILGTSEGESKFLGIKEAVALVEIMKTDYKVDAFLNLDHGKDLDWLNKCIDYGYPAVHFDGSSFPLEKNLEYAKKTAVIAHKNKVLIEGELDGIGNKKHSSLEELIQFSRDSGIDSLAVVIGNVHGFHKNVKLDFKRLKEIKKAIKPFLVLHGGSGISTAQIKKAIQLGIVKINVNTELRMAWKKGMEKALRKKEIKPYKIIPEAIEMVQKKTEEKIKIFKSFNKLKY